MHTRHRLCLHALDAAACRSLISVAKCTQTTLATWRPWLIHTVVGRYHLAKTCMLWPISQKWCKHASDDVCMPWVMLPAIRWCHMATMRSPCLMFMSWCTLATTDGCTHLLVPPVGLCHLVDAHIPYVLSPGQCTQTTTKIALSMWRLNNECVRTLFDVACHWLMLLSWCTHDTSVHACFIYVACHYPMLFWKNEHSTSVRVGLCWSHSLLVEIAFKMHTCHVRCILALVDIVYRWPTFVDWYL